MDKRKIIYQPKQRLTLGIKGPYDFFHLLALRNEGFNYAWTVPVRRVFRFIRRMDKRWVRPKFMFLLLLCLTVLWSVIHLALGNIIFNIARKRGKMFIETLIIIDRFPIYFLFNVLHINMGCQTPWGQMWREMKDNKTMATEENKENESIRYITKQRTEHEGEETSIWDL